MNQYNKPDECDCARCPLRERPFVAHELSPAPQGVILGEGPWNREVLFQRPFIGPSGQLLDNTLRLVGLSRGAFDIGNVTACQAFKGMPDKDWLTAIACCAPYRDALLARTTSPILGLGGWAMHALTGKGSIQSWYGYPLDTFTGRRLLPCLHPAYILREPWWSEDFIRTFQRFAMLINGTWREWEQPPLIWRGSDSGTAMALAALRRDIVCVDSETAGKDPQFDDVICLGFGDVERAVTVIWPPGPWALAAVRRVLKEAQVLSAHNAQHDILVLDKLNLPWRPEQIRDTLLMHAVLHDSMPHRLAIATARYCQPRWKALYHEEGEAKGSEIFVKARESTHTMDELCRYNGLDCINGATLCRDLLVELAASPVWRRQVYAELCERAWVSLDMRRVGVLVDRKRRLERLAQFRRYKSLAEARFHKLAARGHWPDIDLGVKAMNNAVRALFFDHFKQRPLTLTESGKPSLGAWTLQRWGSHFQADKACAVAAKLVLRVRKGEHMIGMVESLPISPDGRLHPGWNPWGALTDRSSCGKPNLMNLPKRPPFGIRDLLIPDPGCVFVGADMSKVELRVIAILAKDVPLLDAFKRGVDVHQVNAVTLFGAKANKAQRDLAKRLVYGFNYGAAAETVWVNLVTQYPKLRLEVIAALRGAWFRAHPAIQVWQKKVYDQACTTKVLRSGLGPRAWIYGKDERPDPSECYNRPVQAAVAKVVNDAKLELHRRGYDIRIECHDEIVLNVCEDRVPDAVRALEEAMHFKAVVDGKQWDLPVDPWVGCSWGAYEEW